MELLEKLAALREKYRDPQDQAQVSEWEVKANQLLLLHSASQNAGVQYLLDELRKEVEKIDETLLIARSEDVNDRERDQLLDRKALYKRFISYFGDSLELKRLEGEIDRNL